jgi:hypothetical protein
MYSSVLVVDQFAGTHRESSSTTWAAPQSILPAVAVLAAVAAVLLLRQRHLRWTGLAVAVAGVAGLYGVVGAACCVLAAIAIGNDRKPA